MKPSLGGAVLSPIICRIYTSVLLLVVAMGRRCHGCAVCIA